MKRYLYNYQTVVEFSESVPAHAVMLRCQPVGNACQTVEQEHLVMSPSYWLQAGSDAFYNRILFGGTTEPHTVFAYVSMGIVATDTYLVKYRGENLLLYRQPTPFTTIGDGITDISENSIQAAYDICHILQIFEGFYIAVIEWHARVRGLIFVVLRLGLFAVGYAQLHLITRSADSLIVVREA